MINALSDDVGMVFSRMTLIDDKGNHIGNTEIVNDISHITYRNIVGACFLYRRCVYEAVGDYNEKMFLVEDWDYCLDSVGLAMGFDNRKEENYLRFPMGLLAIFEPKVDFEYIKSKIDDINKQRNSGRFECALVSSHDNWNTRTPIYNGLNDILDISCAGRWNNNTSVLWEEYGNDKLAFMKECKFTICPENEDTPYYVTEKIYDVFVAGSIPIYTGSANNPEPDIINHDAVLFWDRNNKAQNEACRKEVRRLKDDEKYYDAFISQDKFLPGTAEIIYDKFVELKKRLWEIGE